MPRTWEYKLINAKDVPGGGFFGNKERKTLEAHLNTLGADGWEVVGVDFADAMQSESYFLGLAKRER